MWRRRLERAERREEREERRRGRDIFFFSFHYRTSFFSHK